MCTDKFHLLLQLATLMLAENSFSGTLPSSWAGLTKASRAAWIVLKGQFHDQQLQTTLS